MRFRRMLWATFLAALAVSCGDSSTSGGPVEVVTGIRTLVDSSRGTPSNAEVEGASARALETRLWLTKRPLRDRPACDGTRCALVVLAHGFGGNTARFDAIGRGLAEAGYVVAAPRFPLTNDAAPGGHLGGLGDTVEQPADLSFVIDRLTTAVNGDPLLEGRIDEDRIAVLGHSLGGVTAIAQSRVACCTDARVDAVVLVAPVTSLVEALFGAPFDSLGPPTMVMSGSEDPVVRPDVPQAFYDDVEAPRVLILLEGANHVDLIENTGPPAPALALTRRAVVAFFDRVLGGGDDLTMVLEDVASLGHRVLRDL